MPRQPRELKADFQFGTPDGDFTVQIGATEAPVTIAEYVPEMQALDDAIIQLAVERQDRVGEPISCGRGCDACCRHLVPVSPAEAVHLTEVIAALPLERQAELKARLAAVNEAMERIGLAQRIREGYRQPEEAHEWVSDYFALQIPCPFLEGGACSIYADRPFACREYMVTSPPAECAAYATDRLEKVFVPIHMRAVMERVCVQAGADRKVLPLTWSLDWVAAHPEIAQATFPGVPVITALLQDLDLSCRRLVEEFMPPRPDREPNETEAENEPPAEGERRR